MSGFFALDIDPRHGGVDTLTRLEETNGLLPQTCRSLTGSLGQHILFRYPADRTIKNNVATKLGPGLDVRGDGGYIVAPPSQHISGRLYEVLCAGPLADAPDWLLGLITGDPKATPAGTTSKSWRAIIREGVAEGRRNDAVASLTGMLMRPGPKSPSAVLDLIRCWNALRCKLRWTAFEGQPEPRLKV